MSPHVYGYYPMGCGRTLRLGAGGFLFCSNKTCPRPGAAAAILADSQTEHVVALRQKGFNIKHPLRERLDDQLLACKLDDYLNSLSESPQPLGVYVITPAGEHWNYRRIGELP